MVVESELPLLVKPFFAGDRHYPPLQGGQTGELSRDSRFLPAQLGSYEAETELHVGAHDDRGSDDNAELGLEGQR